jgi:hypothetical protein
MKTIRVFVPPLAVGISWVLGYVVISYAGHGLSSIENYALISGWWSAAYMSSQSRARLRSALILGVAFAFTTFFLRRVGVNILYVDAPTNVASLLQISAIQACVFASPVIADVSFRAIASKWLGRLSSGDD